MRHLRDFFAGPPGEALTFAVSVTLVCCVTWALLLGAGVEFAALWIVVVVAGLVGAILVREVR